MARSLAIDLTPGNGLRRSGGTVTMQQNTTQENTTPLHLDAVQRGEKVSYLSYVASQLLLRPSR